MNAKICTNIPFMDFYGIIQCKQSRLYTVVTELIAIYAS